MSTDLIRYDLLVQDALRSVVRRVLTDTAKDGVPGEHHYYVTFLTNASGVRISSRLREKYPNEMTIVLQHQFWDLAVTEHSFEIGLAFGGIPERLLIPFEALSAFYDPSVQFGLKFEVNSLDADGQTESYPEEPSEQASVTSIAPKAKASKAKIKSVPAADEEPLKKDNSKKLAKESKSVLTQNISMELADKTTQEAKPTADVVSLDAFRKKN